MVNFFSPELLPFDIAMFVVFFILALEIVGILFGFSSLNDQDADVDFDAGLDFDADVDIDMDIDADLEVAFGDTDLDADMVDLVNADLNVWSFLELGRVPLLVWILAMSGGFAMAGYAIQLGLNSTLGFMLPQMLAVAAAIIPALAIGKFIARAFAAIVPKSTTQAVDRRSLGGRTGKITVGTAEPGNPAPATVSDYHGNPHSIRVVPFQGEPALPQGTEIVVLRGSQDNGIFQAMSLHKAQERYNS